MTEEYWGTQKLIGKIGCSSTDCKNDLHSFRRVRPKKGESYRNGVCYNCGIDLIDWERIDQRDLGDVDYTIRSLKYEMFRNHYWNIEIDEKTGTKAQKKGLDEIRIWAAKRIDKYIKPHYKDIWRDGMQTPYEGNIVFYAQHATGLCCRKCIQEWYNIERNRVLTNDEMEYFLELIMLYTEKRLPEISA